MRLRTYRAARLGAAALALLAASAPGRAAESGQSPYLKGYRDFAAGVLPMPGVVIRNDVYLYSGTEHSTLPQGQLTAQQKSVTDILGVTVVTPYTLFGGHYGFSVRGAYTGVSIDQTLAPPAPRPPVTRDGRLDALNDVVVDPFILGWHADRLHWIVSAPVRMPAGSYDKSRIANTGRNVWAFLPQIGVTYFDPASGWDVSAAAVYAVSATNPDTDYRSGDILHMDFGVGKLLTPNFKLGVVGYYAQQLTADSGSGAVYGARKLRIGGVGPGATFSFRVHDAIVTLVAKYYREFDAQNTTQGDAGTLSLRVRF